MWSREETDGDGRVDPLDVCLLDEDLSRFEAEVLDLLLGYRLAASQLLDLPAFQEDRKGDQEARWI